MGRMYSVSLLPLPGLLGGWPEVRKAGEMTVLLFSSVLQQWTGPSTPSFRALPDLIIGRSPVEFLPLG